MTFERSMAVRLLSPLFQEQVSLKLCSNAESYLLSLILAVSSLTRQLFFPPSVSFL